MSEISIREYGYLIRRDAVSHDLKVGFVRSDVAWTFLEELAYSSDSQHRFIDIAKYQGQKAYKVVNFVGALTAPDGTQIEVLPKVTEDAQSLEATRDLLWKMLTAVHDLIWLEGTAADLRLKKMPLPEVLISAFLQHLAVVVRRGVAKDYVRIEDEEPFLRGQLQLARQLRQPPDRRHRFQIEYDLYSEDRAENRLIFSALQKILLWSRAESNQRLARELQLAFWNVPPSSDYSSDFARWRASREMTHYQVLLPWLKLILREESPFAIKGQHAGISFLFAMENLFEKYVFKTLEAQLGRAGYTVKSQLRSRHLSDQPKRFLLKPDIAIFKGGQLQVIIDTKWKLLRQAWKDDDDVPESVRVTPSDVHQIFAYGHKYRPQAGLMLVFPKWSGFTGDIPPYALGEKLMLKIAPYDLSRDSCLGLQEMLDAAVTSSARP